MTKFVSSSLLVFVYTMTNRRLSLDSLRVYKLVPEKVHMNYVRNSSYYYIPEEYDLIAYTLDTALDTECYNDQTRYGSCSQLTLQSIGLVRTS